MTSLNSNLDEPEAEPILSENTPRKDYNSSGGVTISDEKEVSKGPRPRVITYGTDHHHPIHETSKGLMCGCTSSKIWFSMIFGFLFAVLFGPVSYFVLNYSKHIYQFPVLVWSLGILDIITSSILIITWIICVGKLKHRDHEEKNEQIESILFMILGFLTAFENAIASFKNLKDQLYLGFLFSLIRVGTVSLQCAFISNFENYYFKKNYKYRLYLTETVSVLLFFYNLFIFALNCTIGNVFGNSSISTVSTILMAASIHYRLDSAIYFAHFSYGSALQADIIYDPCASTLLNVGAFSNEIVSLKNGRYRLRGGSAGLGKAISYIILGIYTTLKTIKYLAQNDIPPLLRNNLSQSILTFELFLKLFMSFGLGFCSLFAWKTLRHIIDKTNSQSMWKFYIRLFSYGSIFMTYYISISIHNFFKQKVINGVVTSFECIEAVCQIVFLMMFHSRKSMIECDYSAFWIFFLWFSTIYNVLFAIMYVVEEVCDPHHLFPIFDAFGVGLSVAFRLLCATMFLNIVTQGVWKPDDGESDNELVKK